jgi:hypothetical protein
MSKDGETSIQVTVRFEESLVREITAEQNRLSKESNGVRVTLSDAVRYLVRKGLSRKTK